MRVLVCCAAGRVRSVTMAWCLKRRYPRVETLVCGIASTTDGNSPATIEALAAWAERIVLVEKAHIEKIPAAFREKVRVLELGPDIWARPWHEDLVRKCEALIAQGW